MADDCGGGTAATVHHEVLHALGGVCIQLLSKISRKHIKILFKALLMNTIDPTVILI